LEEPPARTVFLLVAESNENMLQTILSRVQLHKMGRLKAAGISAALSSETDDHAQLASLAELADGDLNLARQLLNDKSSVTYSIDFFIRWMRACFVLNMEQLVDLLEEFNVLGREQQKDLLSRSTGILRKGLMYSSGGDNSTGLLREEMDFMHKFSRFINPENSEGMLAEINQAHYHIERNANPRIVFTDLSFKLSDLLKVGALN
jgi:DNA polymerase-3 subunit delta'